MVERELIQQHRHNKRVCALCGVASQWCSRRRRLSNTFVHILTQLIALQVVQLDINLK